VLQPWQKKSVEKWKQFSESSGYEDRLLEAWVSGDDKIFQALTKMFAKSWEVQDNECIIVVKEEPVKEVKKLCKFFPQEIIGIWPLAPRYDITIRYLCSYSSIIHRCN
jgi:hypothetical protein